MEYKNDTSRLTLVTVFLAYDQAEIARRIKIIFDRAHAEIDEELIFDLRLWRLDILKLAGCWAQALRDLADADLFTMGFNSPDESIASPELNYLVKKWFSDGCGRQSVLLASPGRVNEHNGFDGVLDKLTQRCGLDFSPSGDHCDQLHEFFVRSGSRKIKTISNQLN